jgi:hypothetical protein
VVDHLPGPREANEFVVIDAVGIGEDTRAIDDGNVFLGTEKDLI